MPRRALQHQAIGRRVAKEFLVHNDNDDDNLQMFAGRVTSFDATQRWYTVEYDDGDVEDVTWTHLQEILLPLETTPMDDDTPTVTTTTTTTTEQRQQPSPESLAAATAVQREKETKDGSSHVVTPSPSKKRKAASEISVSSSSLAKTALFSSPPPPTTTTPTTMTMTSLDKRIKGTTPRRSTRRCVSQMDSMAEDSSQGDATDDNDSDQEEFLLMENDDNAERDDTLEYDNNDDDDDDDDDDFIVVQEHDKGTIAQEQERKERRAAARRATKQAGKDSSTAKSAAVAGPKGRFKTKRASGTDTASSLSTLSCLPPQSVAVRGLPQGSMAVGPGGFAVRSLDGIRPLLTPATIKKAVQLVTAGQIHEAARVVQVEDAHCLQAFLQQASQRLSLDIAAATTLRGGSLLSERAQARLDQGLQPIQAELPGRLLVVHAGTARVEGGDPVCPADLVDQVFESAAELHQHTKGPVATFAMNVASDPAFGPWSVLIHRLESAGLVARDEDKDESKSEGGTNTPHLVRIDWDGGKTLPKVSWQSYSKDVSNDQEGLQWALLEGATRGGPPVVLGAPASLVSQSRTDSDATRQEIRSIVSFNKSVLMLLPPLSSETADVRLPASLLEKAIRRSFCSPQPILEACSALLMGANFHGIDRGKSATTRNPPYGGTYAMLSTVWTCMLEDAAPFAAPDDGSLLGLQELFVLSLVAKADPTWRLPGELVGKAVVSALRTQQQPGNFRNIENTAADEAGLTISNDDSSALRNAFFIMRAAVGGRLVQRKSLDKAKPMTLGEESMVDDFQRGISAPIEDERLIHLDNECRLAAYDFQISPMALLLVQACLPEPPASWKKHSLPSLAKHIHNLITHANARMPDFRRLTRLAAWGNSDIAPVVEHNDSEGWRTLEPDTAREVVTSTGMISEKEKQVIDCFEAVQRWRARQEKEITSISAASSQKKDVDPDTCFIRVEVGSPPTEHDGRSAFLLAFAMAEEIEVFPEIGKPEVVSVLFCGDVDEPLLVQRIGKARKEAGQVDNPSAGASGAKAVPSLGYVQRQRSEKDRALVEAAELAVHEKWKDGRTVSLPLPPPGFQWKLPHSISGKEEIAEKQVELRASLKEHGVWDFSICGIPVLPFDARIVIAPCSVDLVQNKPLPLDHGHNDLLRSALYIERNVAPENLLESLVSLHNVAVNTRDQGASEGVIFDWLPLACESPVPSRIWRDAILAIKTREKADLVLGPVEVDGTCKRDMTEGCLLRIFYALESLYPTALVKSGAMKWFVRQRGAGYHHMMDSLEGLSRNAINIYPSQLTIAKSTSAALPRNDLNISHDSKLVAGTRQERQKRKGAGKASRAIVEQSSIGHPEESSANASMHMFAEADENRPSLDEEEDESLPVPEIKTRLWPHQKASVEKVVSGVKDGKRGHADASAVGSGKSLTALATIVRLLGFMNETSRKRSGVLVMLPTKALVKEWLLQIAAHTKGFHVIEQRETGQLFSLTYSKSDPPIDGNSIVISTLDRVRAHPFARQAAWDFVVIDECLAIQNADAKRCPAAWQQIEVSALGVLMLSATFFRSKFDDLFYMIRMFRSPLPRSMEWLPATIHEHIVCQVPETDRNWTMRSEPVPLKSDDLKTYRGIIEAYKRNQMNSVRSPDFRRLFIDLVAFLKAAYEGRGKDGSFRSASPMADACYSVCKSLLKQGRRPLVFADTSDEAEHFRSVLRLKGVNARTWAEVSSDKVAGGTGNFGKGVIVAVKSVEGQGINMQGHADAIVCRPTPGDHLEQMKGRIDRPGQTTKDLILIVLVAEHTFEEAKFANIHLAGNFFREYIAPVASRYKEKIDLEATLAVGGTAKLKRGTVQSAWRRSLEAAGQSGTFASLGGHESSESESESAVEGSKDEEYQSQDDSIKQSSHTGKNKSKSKSGRELNASCVVVETQHAPRNRVLRNKGDPVAVREAKLRAKNGHASLAVQRWLFPPKQSRGSGLPKESLLRYSDAKPPVVLDRSTVEKALQQLSKDPKLAALIQRVGAETLVRNIGELRKTTQASLLDRCIRAIIYTMISVQAGNSFVRKLSIKIGVCLEGLDPVTRKKYLDRAIAEMQERTGFEDLTGDKLLDLLLQGKGHDILFTSSLLRPLVDSCDRIPGKPGYPHLWGGKPVKCGAKDDPAVFLEKARQFSQGKSDVEVSCSFSQPKASFIVALLEDFEKGKVSAHRIADASDREAAAMLLKLKGIGDWSATSVLLFDMKRANIMSYGDLTLRNYLNDLYDINHNVDSETLVESATDFPDTAANRNLIDALATRNGWEPYRSVILYLCYHLSEEALCLI